MWTTSNSEGLGRESSMAGHFPPNSRVTGVKFFAAADMTTLATRGLPENFIHHGEIILEPQFSL